jgi:putative ABC transport system substrate-binding protein
LGIEIIAAPVRDESELESAIAAQAQRPNGGFIVVPDGFTDPHRAHITSLAARHHVPAVYAYRFSTALGGLLSYGINLTDNFPRAAAYADRILKGAKAADLPVQAPDKYMLTINLRTAKELGLNVPLSLQQRADEVIE